MSDKIGPSSVKVTVPFRSVNFADAFDNSEQRLALRFMLTGDVVKKWGRRGSDISPAPPVAPRRDVVIEGMIAHERVELVYQPLIDTMSGRMIGAEALVRCGIARDGGALFARANAAALGERLSRVVQRKALRAAAVWEGPLRNMSVSINLLPADICRPGYERWLLDEIDAVGIDPKRITLEITESTLLGDHDVVAARLATLREASIRIAVDDFGTGYSNLGYLTAFPLDMLKIDQGLVENIVSREHDRIVVKALVRLARELNLKVVVEGVETAEQLALIKEWGCDVYQGFLASAALAEADLMRFAGAR